MTTVLRVNAFLTIVFAILLIACTAVMVRQARLDIEREVSASMGLVTALTEGCRVVSRQYCPTADEITSKLQHYRHFKIVHTESGVDMSGGIASQSSDSVPLWFYDSVWGRPALRLIEHITVKDDKLLLVADPADELLEVWESVVQLFLLIVACAVVANVAVLVGGRISLKPIRRFLSALDEIERGNYQERLPNFSISEANRLACHFNKMAVALEKQQYENQLLNRQLLCLQEQERRELARELHDDLGQHLCAIKAVAGTILLSLENSERVGINARKIIDISSAVLLRFRNIVHRLRPTELDRTDFYHASRQLCKAWSDRVNIPCQYFCADSLPTLNSNQSIHLYRIVQETLNNVVKHASASLVEVCIDSSQDMNNLYLSIADNGVGINENVRPIGMGIRFMKERAAAIGGDIKFKSNKGIGTKILVEVTVSVNSEALDYKRGVL